VTLAAARLRLAQPTVTAQIRALERSIGDRLFSRRGRNLVLTDVGRWSIDTRMRFFALGRELSDALEGRPVGSRCVSTSASPTSSPSSSPFACFSPR